MIKGLIIETPPLDAYEQMAADETLCETLPAQHILRFYNWKGSGVTFGYSQRHAAVLAAVSAGASATRQSGSGGTKQTLPFLLFFPDRAYILSRAKPITVCTSQ